MAEGADGIQFTDLGDHVLKDLAMPVRIFQLSGQGLDTEFPPLRSLNGTPTALPISRTSFVGREQALNQLLDDLLEPGLITLTGPGGTGKTRLAVEAAREVRGSLEGTWFVDLSSAADADQVINVAATALGVADVGQAEGSLSRLTERIGERPCLIVLDNCEHIVEPAAHLAERLLAGCAGLRVLATSRDLLGLAHERARRVPLWNWTAPSISSWTEPPEQCTASILVPKNRLIIERICRRLDGIPLAIELAAPRLRHIALDDFEDRLGDVFRLLVGSRSRGVERHETLQAVVDWSYNLLTSQEQVILRRLSVLSGSFRMEAAEAVATGEPIITPVEDTIFRLVDQSLVDHDGQGRYRQLETIRAYGQARLRESGESEAVRSRHLSYFADWADGVGPGLKRNRFFDCLDQLGAEVENLHSALEWAVEQQDHRSALRLVASTVHFGTLTSQDSLVKLAERALDGAADGPADLVAAAHVEFGLAATTLGWGRYAHHARRAMELLGPETPAGDDGDIQRVWALAGLAQLTAIADPPDLAQTKSYVVRAVALADRCNEPAAAMAAQSALAWDLMRSGDIEGARTELAGVVEAGGPLSKSLWFTMAVFWSGVASMRAAEWRSATAYYEQALVLFRRVSYKLYSQWVLDHLSTAALQLKDYAAARAYAEEGVAVSVAGGLGADSNLAYLYERLGYLEWRRAEHSQSAHYYQQALAHMSVGVNAHDHAALRCNLAVALAAGGELDQARDQLATALEIIESLTTVTLATGAVAEPPVANLAQGLAHLALAVALPEEAAELAGLSLKLHPVPLTSSTSPGARLHNELKIALGDEDRYNSAIARGAALEEPLVRIRQVLRLVVLPA